MQILKKYQQELLWSFILLMIFTVAGLSYHRMLSEERTTTFIEDRLQENTILLNTVVHSLNKRADTIFDIKINQPDILKLLSVLSEPNQADKKRKELYKLLKPTYELLKQNGIRQLHFHLPGGVSFLRFHKPEKYGDRLAEVRYSIDLVNKSKKVVRGFEEGRVFNGFRNVYPLFYKEKFIATVEISYSIRAIAQTLSYEDKAFYGLLIQKNIVDTKVWQENRQYYLLAHLDSRYLWDKKAFDTLYNHSNEIKKLRKIESRLHAQTMDELIKKPKDFLLPFEYQNKSFIAIFHTLHNVAGQRVGYIVSFHESKFFRQTYRHELSNDIITFLVGLLLAILFFLFLKKEKESKEMLKKKSNYDPLTNLLNRRGFETAHAVLYKTLRRKKGSFSLLFIDIDNFKTVNDRYGHDVGDLALKHLAKILKRCLRESDVVARWGGEEFIILLNETNRAAASEIAEKLRLSVQRSRHKNLPSFTISIGMVHENIDMPFETLLKAADQALYEAKASGRNRVVIYEGSCEKEES